MKLTDCVPVPGAFTCAPGTVAPTIFSSVELAMGIAIVILVIVVVLLVIMLIRAKASLRRCLATPSTVQTPQPAPEKADDVPAGLIQELMTLADLATAPAVAVQTERVMGTMGVDVIRPRIGDAFDSHQHSATSTEPDADPDRDQHIAGIFRTGWRRGGDVLRPADVAVWTRDPSH